MSFVLPQPYMNITGIYKLTTKINVKMLKEKKKKHTHTHTSERQIFDTTIL